jgi:hypothetical protein
VAQDTIRVTDTIGVFACPDGFALRLVASVDELKPFDLGGDSNVCVDEADADPDQVQAANRISRWRPAVCGVVSRVLRKIRLEQNDI